MKLFSMLLVAVFAVSLADSAWAAEKKKEGEVKKEVKKVSVEDQFKKLDKNNDGKVDIDEFMGRATADETKKRRETQFAEMDKNSDKAVTLEEMKAWQKAREAKLEKAPKKEPKKTKP